MFPLGIDYDNFSFTISVQNNTSAIKNPAGIDKYFKEEVGHGAL